MGKFLVRPYSQPLFCLQEKLREIHLDMQPYTIKNNKIGCLLGEFLKGRKVKI